MVECVTTAVMDHWKSLRAHKGKVVFSTCFVMFLAGLPMCLGVPYVMFITLWPLAVFFNPMLMTGTKWGVTSTTHQR